MSGGYENTIIAIKGVGVFETWFDSEGLIYKGMEEIPINFSVNSVLCGPKRYMPLSIENTTFSSGMIYPNPFISSVKFTDIKDGFYCVKNMLGQTIISGHLDNGEINLNELPDGNYILNIITEDSVFSEIIIKE